MFPVICLWNHINIYKHLNYAFKNSHQTFCVSNLEVTPFFLFPLPSFQYIRNKRD